MGDPSDDSYAGSNTGAFYVVFVEVPQAMPDSSFAGATVAIENHIKV